MKCGGKTIGLVVSDRPKPVFDRNRDRDRNLHDAIPNPKPYRNKLYNFTETDTETDTETETFFQFMSKLSRKFCSYKETKLIFSDRKAFCDVIPVP